MKSWSPNFSWFCPCYGLCQIFKCPCSNDPFFSDLMPPHEARKPKRLWLCPLCPSVMSRDFELKPPFPMTSWSKNMCNYVLILCKWLNLHLVFPCYVKNIPVLSINVILSSALVLFESFSSDPVPSRISSRDTNTISCLPSSWSKEAQTFVILPKPSYLTMSLFCWIFFLRSDA